MLSTALAALLGGLVGGSHGGVQRRQLAHHALVGLLLVSVNGLCMLAEIVETRELLSAMTSERTFAGVLSNVPGEVFAPAKNHATIAITTTLERFCRRGAIAPVCAWAIRLLGLLEGVVWREDEGGGHVSVGGIRGRGVHYQGRRRDAAKFTFPARPITRYSPKSESHNRMTIDSPFRIRFL
jgi:hypothetical protein